FAFSLEPSLFADDARRRAAIEALCERRRHFGIGYSWGGFESLIMPARIEHLRSARPWAGGPLVRLHVGLEDPDDLIADLQAGFEAMEHVRESGTGPTPTASAAAARGRCRRSRARAGCSA